MATGRVVATHRIFPETQEILRGAGHVLDVNPGPDAWPAGEVRRRCADADALLAFMTDRVDEGFLAACPRLRVVACAVKGADSFDAAACERAGVWLSAVPDLLTDPTAELAVGLAVALCRNVLPGDDLVRSGRFAGWRPVLYGPGLGGSAVGIAGMGRVGRAIARRVAPFGPARMAYHDARSLPEAEERSLLLERTSFLDLLASSDVVFLALPLGEGTRHLIDAAALARARPGCRLVNAGRGGVVDEEAVARALAAGALGGYAADVFEFEDWSLPDRPRAIPAALLAQRDRTVFTPHLGSAVLDVRRRIEATAARNVLAALQGVEPPDAVNRPPRPRAP